MAEHEKFFDNIGTVFDVKTAAFRFAVVSKALGYNEEDIPVIPVMYRNKLLKAGMTSQIERIVFLFAAGVITDEELHELFLIVNMSSYSPLLAAYDAYKLMKGEELTSPQAAPSLDSIVSPIAAAALVLLIIIIVFMITQKKRLAKKDMKIKKEKSRLCLRLTIFTALLVLSLSFPYLIGYNYKFAAIWLSYSVLIAFTIS